MEVISSHETYEPMGGLLPAHGWRAVFAYDDGSDERDGKRFAHAEPMVAFALTRTCEVCRYENGIQTNGPEEIHIVGYTASDIGIHPAEESDNFMGYLAPGTVISNHVEQRAKKYVLAHEIETTGTPT